MLAEGRFGPLSHLYLRLNRPTSARYPAWDSPWMLDPRAGRRRLPAQSRLRTCSTSSCSSPARTRRSPARSSARARSASAWRTTPPCCCAPPAACSARSSSATRCRTTAPTASSRSPGATRSLHHDDTMRVITAAGEETVPVPDGALVPHRGARHPRSLATRRAAAGRRRDLRAGGGAHRPGLRARRTRLTGALDHRRDRTDTRADPFTRRRSWGHSAPQSRSRSAGPASASPGSGSEAWRCRAHRLPPTRTRPPRKPRASR